MKKIFSLVTAILCAAMLTMPFSAADTADNADAFKLYQRATRKMNNVSSVEMKANIKMTMETAGQPTEMKTAAYITQILDDDKIEMEMLMKGDPLTANVYYRNGYMYQEVNGQKYKIKMDVEDVLKSSYDFDRNLTSDMFKDATVEEIEGGHRVRFQIKGDAVKDLVDETITGILDSAGMSDTKVRMSNIGCSMNIGTDGSFETYAMAYVVAIDSKEISTKIKYNINCQIVSVNTVDKINFPVDLGTYTTL